MNEYKFAPITLLNSVKSDNENVEKVEYSAKKLQNTLYSLGINAKVQNVLIGPTFITYQIKLGIGVRVNKKFKRRFSIKLRIQGAYISEKEVENVVEFLRQEDKMQYDVNLIELIEKSGENENAVEDDEEYDDADPLLNEAIEAVIETGIASTSFIQRRFKLGYARAGRIIDQMEQRGIISGYQGSKPREVLMSKERWNKLKKEPSL